MKKTQFAFLFMDIAVIMVSVFLSFLFRFEGQIPPVLIRGYYVFGLLAMLITPPVFYFFNLYKISWSYVSLSDLPTIGKGVFTSVLSVGTVMFFLREYYYFAGFPRSVIFIYGIVLFIMVGGLRFSKRIYWQLIKGSALIDEEKNNPLPLLKKLDIPGTVLVTGGAGYIGSVLVRELLNNGFRVKVVDKLMFGKGSIEELEKNPDFRFIEADILDLETMAKALADVDAVVHLAAIVGEAACSARKELAIKTNYLGTVHLARLCKAYGIRRFIYASTCSAYGKSEEEDIMEENSKATPVDFYGETKVYAEKDIARLIDRNFSPTILRFSTVYGLSPRMRFDLVVNIFAKNAVTKGEISIFSGSQIRPLIHVADLARAICLCLKNPIEKVGNQIFNVGDNNENYLISELGAIVKELVPALKVNSINEAKDQRSYRVNFNKIEKFLSFRSQKKVKDGMQEIIRALEDGRIKDAENKIYYNHLVLN